MSGRSKEEPMITAAQCDTLEDLVDQMRPVDWSEVESAFEAIGERPGQIDSCTRESASQLIGHFIGVLRTIRP